MQLLDVIPDGEILCALEPEELGLRMLPLLARWPEAHRSQPLVLDTLIVTAIGDHRGYGNQYPAKNRGEVEIAIREAWAWLEGQALLIKHPGYMEPNNVRTLSRRAAKLASEPDARRALNSRRISKETLHPIIREDVWALYHRGKFDTAVFEAMKAVEVSVREAAGLAAQDIGTGLIRKAFAAEDGPLTDLSAERAERQARSDLFAGTIGSYKNPHSHRNVALDDPDEAAEIIMLANHLLRIVASRRQKFDEMQ
jgi:uncharacterized protein (TIGR02391 family)